MNLRAIAAPRLAHSKQFSLLEVYLITLADSQLSPWFDPAQNQDDVLEDKKLFVTLKTLN